MKKKKTNNNSASKAFSFLKNFSLIVIVVIALVSQTTILVKLNVCAPTYQLQAEKTIQQVSNGQMVSFLYDMTEDEITYIVQKVFDQPEFFWMSHKYSRMSFGNLTFLFFKKNDKDHDVVEKKQKEIDLIVDTMLKERLTSDMTDYQKALVIYDWLIQNTTYEIIDNENDQTMYNAIVTKKAVCSGYAHALTYIFNKIGIEAETTGGYALNDDGTRKEKHRWTVAYINGEPCYFDPTWDDEDDGVTRYNYFGLPASLFKKSHEAFPLEQWKEAVSVSTDYYRNTGKYLDKFSEQALIDMVITTIDQEHVVCFRCHDESVISSVKAVISQPAFIGYVNEMLGQNYRSMCYSINQANVVEIKFKKLLFV